MKGKKRKRKWNKGNHSKANLAGPSTPFDSKNESEEDEFDVRQLVKKEVQRYL